MIPTLRELAANCALTTEAGEDLVSSYLRSMVKIKIFNNTDSIINLTFSVKQSLGEQEVMKTKITITNISSKSINEWRAFRNNLYNNLPSRFTITSSIYDGQCALISGDGTFTVLNLTWTTNGSSVRTDNMFSVKHGLDLLDAIIEKLSKEQGIVVKR